MCAILTVFAAALGEECASLTRAIEVTLGANRRKLSIKGCAPICILTWMPVILRSATLR
jgi:hypothetical protein